jgi:hypothetical protein
LVSPTKEEEGVMSTTKLLAVVAIGLAALAFLSVGPARAVEGGLGHYPIGNEDFMMGAIPPPGFYLKNIMLYYRVTDYEDIRGPGGIKLKDIGLGKPDVEGDTFVNAVRLIWVTPIKVLGMSWTTHLIVPFQYLHLKADIGPIGVTDNYTGLKDITFAPFALARHYKNFHYFFALDIDIPVGHYNKNEIASTGNNYWTFRPIIAGSYVTDGGFEVGSKIGYNMSTRNNTTDYRSGQELLIEYIVGQKFGNWKLGANGYYYYQTTDDYVNNQVPGFDGNKGRAFAIGPAIEYNYKNMFFALKYQWEMAVENKPEGQRAWLNFVYCF